MIQPYSIPGLAGDYLVYLNRGLRKITEEEKKGEEPDDSSYWPVTRVAIRFLLWTIVFSLVGMAVILVTGFHLVL